VAEENTNPSSETPRDFLTRVKFEVYGEGMIEKKVHLSGNSGRVYLPLDWVGRHVKVVRMD